MPIYEYRCTSCQRTIEVLQKISDPPLKKCETCSGTLEKQFSRTSFQLKGGGWFGSGYGSSTSSESSKEGPKEGKAGKDDKGGSKESASSDTAVTTASTDSSSGGCGSGSCGCAS